MDSEAVSTNLELAVNTKETPPPNVVGLRVLIVDDDPIVAQSLSEFLGQEGYATCLAHDYDEALAALRAAASDGKPPIGLVISDLNMPGQDGLELLRTVRKQHKSMAVIVITGFGKIETAVEAIKLGAVEYLTKPVIDDELRIAVGKAIQQHVLMAENQTLRNQLTERYGLGNIVGADYRMQKIYDLIEAVAEGKTTVLIEGESGTGKSMVARAIHAQSPRNAQPFVTFSCGAIPETLLESELFGHVKGAFTGADADKPGKILAANHGTLFIDEINSATPALQLKLLRILQDKQFEPVGSTKTVQVDVRFVLATNKPLPQLVAAGQFREDLFYRINVVNIKLPRLSERTGDVPLLADKFLEKYTEEVGKDRTLSDDALAALVRYPWPGNVRELENAIERAVVLSRKPTIEVDDLPDAVRQSASGKAAGPGAGPGVGAGLTGAGAGSNGSGAGRDVVSFSTGQGLSLSKAMEEPERLIILAALEANGWNRQATAKQLEIDRTTLYKKIKHHGLDRP